MSESTREPALDTSDRWARRSVGRWRSASAVSAVSMLVILAWAPTKELLQPWRKQQWRYNALAQDRGLAPVAVRVRQIWIPEAEKADRCGTCHLGMIGEAPLDGKPPFNAHPPVPHTPESYGCTYCHSGQGRATVIADAHGEEGSWPHPVFDGEQTEAGCGTCHSGVALPLPEDVEGADELVREFACLECHQTGSDTVAALDTVALRGVPEDWVQRHRGLILPEERPSLSAIDDDDLQTLNDWLQTRIGAPRLARGKMVFHQLGCLGCHRRGNVGGDVGPELTQIGDTDARGLWPEEESDSGTLPRWLREHLLAPQELVQDSRMPPVDTEELERESDVDDLVTYLASLREDAVPEALTPSDRARVLFGLGRDFPTSGRGLFEAFCSSCHGTEGEGLEMETLGMVTPMIGTRGVLATVTPRYFRASILRGRRGRYMPAWGPQDGGLSLEEIDALVGYLQSQAFPAPPLEAMRANADIENGREVFAQRCAFCHVRGDDEAGFGSDLLAAENLRHFSQRVLYGAIAHGWVEEGMPAFAFLPPTDLRDLVAFLRRRARASLDEVVVADGLHSHLGHQLWLARCDDCHGSNGEGGEGPMLNTKPYLVWAEDAYLARRILDHRGNRARAEIGKPSKADLDAMVDYMRSWSGQVAPASPPVPDPDAVARGRALYEPRCTECHGEEGRGKTSTALGNPDFLSLVSRPFLVMTILEGRKGTPMRAWREQTERPVGLEDAYDLADYILSLGSAPSASAQREPTPSKEVR